jgi:uncharacterized protein YndB with AHSA1/START domain
MKSEWPVTSVVRSHQIIINAPLQSAFDYVADLTRHPEWSGGRLKIEALTPGPVAVGKEYLSHGDVAGQKDRPNSVEVTQYEPPQRFAFVSKDPDFGKVSHTFTFTQQTGGILITRTMTLSLNPIVAFAFRFFIYPLIGSPSMNKSLAALKTKLEENVASSSQ